MGKSLFTTGITVFCAPIETNKSVERYGWMASLDWQEPGIDKPKTVQGTIKTRYFEETLEEAIETVLTLAAQWGIKPFPTMNMFLYYKGEGEDTDFPPPENYREMLRMEAERRGWETYTED
ncbi:hypothetical protein SMD22_00655 (plasmid) [Brevibacillus halotolerans]|nr:hypothetical protein SMD22_00655 [Brevibacillus halotolerans]